MKRFIPEPRRPETLFDPCIKCTICVSACPVAQTTATFPGPKQAGPDAQRFRGRGEPVEGPWINLCSGCYRCQVACPADVPIAEINLFAKQRYAAEKGRDVATELLTHAHWFNPWGQRFHWFATPLLRMKWARWLAEKLFGVDRRAPLPTFARESFRTFARRHESPRAKHKVAYFYGCFTDSNAPEVGRAVVKVLEAAGVEVIFPVQQCCGAALIGAGNFDRARRQDAANLAAFEQALDQGAEAIVVGSPSCALALSHETGEVLGLGHSAVYSRVVDLFTYLHRLDEAGELNLKWKETPLHAAYHEACHLTALGFGAHAPALLRRIPGVQVRVLDAGCCGLAGTYGLKHKTADLARQIGAGVARRVAEWRPDVVLSECEGCRMQIEHLTGVPAKHPAEVLADALVE
jgi:glycerol-3-phosphate dehydrogenase subunit C